MYVSRESVVFRMYSCREVAERASLLVDGELGPLQGLKMRVHLAMCRACTTFVGQIRITRDLVKAAGGVPHDDERERLGEISARHYRIPPSTT